jgi:hypothetical protein
MSTENLNFIGQVVLTGAASIAVNGITHPLGTIETCMQAREPIPWRAMQFGIKMPFVGLYRGFTAICCVEGTSFGIAYVTNDAFKSHLGPIGSIFAAAAISTPVIGVGEGAMKNRQANNMSYMDGELWKRSFRTSGLIMTLYRELFWNLGIFYATPKMSDEFSRRWPDLNPVARQAIAAAITGSMIGFVTTPIAGIKTVIQSSKEDLTIFSAARKITAFQQTNNPQRSINLLFAGATSRVGYLGVGMCMVNLVYQGLPGYLPDVLKKHQ